MAIYGILVIMLLLTQSGGVYALNSQSAPGAQLGNYAIVFVSRKIPGNGTLYMAPGETGSIPGVGPYSRFQVSAPGKLIVREANGTLRILVDGSQPTAASLRMIDVNAPDVSYDGTKIVFAGLVTGTYDRSPLTNPGGWRIYVINVDGTGLRQVTFSDRDTLDLSQFRDVASNFRKYDDTDPVWLPDGRIVFSSTRWPSFGQYGGVRTSNLYVVNANGAGMHRITSERSGADRPLVDPLTGRIVYSRWWRNFRVATNNMATVANPAGGYFMKDGLLSIVRSQPPPNENEVGGFHNLERNTWHLATINPDGTNVVQWGGRSSSYFHGQISNHAYGGGFTTDGSLYANFFPMNNMTEAAGFGGIRLYRRGPRGYSRLIGVTVRDDATQPLVRYNPPSHGVYRSAYAAEPEVLPDGRLIISYASDIRQDYGLYTINSNGTGLTLLYDNPGTTELRARVIRPRPLPPIIQDQITQVARPLPPLENGPYDVGGTFTFNALNVYFNAPVDTEIISAMPAGSAGSIRFFIDHQRWQQNGSHESLDWPILMKEIPVERDGSITTSSPADVPLFEQIRSARPGYTVPLTGRTTQPIELGGAAHVAGMNFGRPGETVTCVGCHAGHSMIPVPSPEQAQWTNLAPGATVRVSSLNASLSNSNGLIDRRVKMSFPPNKLWKYWMSKSGLAPTSQWVQLTFPVPVTVRTVRLWNIPAADSSIKVMDAKVRLFIDREASYEVASNTSGALSENGTNVSFDDVYARTILIEFPSVSGSVAGLGEVEVIARAEADAPLYMISGELGIAETRVEYSSGNEVLSTRKGAFSLPQPKGWTGTITPSHPCYSFSPENRSYNNLAAAQTSQNFTPNFNPGSGCADIQVLAGGVLKSRYGLPPGNSTRMKFNAVNSGPVEVVSANGKPIVASQKVIYGGVSYSELIGLPAERLSQEYWYPIYNNVNIKSQLLVTNMGGGPTNITVHLAGNQIDSYVLQAGQVSHKEYPNQNNGPMRVVSSAEPVVSSVRLLFGVNSYAEVLGMPAEKLSREYWYPVYDNVKANSQLWVGNTGSGSTTVTVFAAGQQIDSFVLAGGQKRNTNYPLSTGPLRVISSAEPVVSSIRMLYEGGSYSELFGLPVEQLSREYWYPTYNNTGLRSQLRIGNAGSGPTTITVYLAGGQIDSYVLQAGQVEKKSYPVNGGPLHIVSSAEPIVSSIRLLYITAAFSSLSEMLGLPAAELSSRYIIPGYNNEKMKSDIRFAVP